MSTLKVNNLQVGQDSTATNNLTWFQPGSPDGTIRLGSGNAGSATTKFTFDKDGNLTCVGDITANSIIAPIEGTLDDWIVHAGDTNTKFGFPADDTFSIETGGSARLRIKSTGQVTIGSIAATNNASGILHTKVSNATSPVVFENDTENADVVIRTTGTNKHSVLGFGDGADNFIGNIDYDHQNNAMVFDTNGGERLNISSAGVVTQVETGTGNGQGGIKASTASAGGNAGFGFITGGTQRFSIVTIGSAGSEALRVYDVNNSAERFRIHSDGQTTIGNDHVGAGTWDGQLVVATTTGGVITVGDTGSGEKLHLEGGSGAPRIGSASNHDLKFFTNGTSNVRINIKSTGQVRIDGPTAAAHGLRFTPNGWNGYDNRMGYCGSSGADFWWSSNWNPTDGARDHSGYATNFIRQNISNGYLSFGTGPVNTSASERLKIDKDGFIKHSFTSNNSTVAEGLFINNMNNGTGNNASLIFSNDSGTRKKASISYIDTGNYGTGDMAFCLDNDADSGELHVTNHERFRITKDGYVHAGNTGHGTNKVGGQNITGQDYDPYVKILANSSNHWLAQLRSDHTSGNGVFLRAGNSSSTYTLYACGYDENNAHLVVRGDGTVGIGETSPDGRFHVTHTGENNVYFEGNASTLGSRLILKNSNTTANCYNDLSFEDAGGQSTSIVRGYNTDNASNEGYLAFFCRPNGGTPTKWIDITATGELRGFAGTGKMAFNGCKYYQWGGSAASSATFSVNVPVYSNGNIYKITAMFAHHNSSHSCYREGTYAAYSGHNGMQITNDNVSNHTSGNAGSWTITRGNAGQPVVITKTAGTYNGAGHWFIHVLAGTT